MRSKGAKIPEQWESLEDADISELTNTFAYNMYQDPVQYMANGGEVGDPDDEFIQAVNTKLGRTPDGRPKEQGLKPVIDLEDAVNVTPIGDVLSAKDAYNAARNNDWLGVGLATATMIPFVPRAISTVRRSTPTVKNYRSSLSNALDKAVKLGEKERRMSARLNNETYETVQRLMDDPSYMRRAQQVKEKYGDDYTQIYADLIDAYKMIDTRDQIVTPDLIKQAISKLPKGMQSIKKASEQFKSMRSYTKWFNTIPLLGVGAVGANKYFTSNENRD